MLTTDLLDKLDRQFSNLVPPRWIRYEDENGWSVSCICAWGHIIIEVEEHSILFIEEYKKIDGEWHFQSNLDLDWQEDIQGKTLRELSKLLDEYK